MYKDNTTAKIYIQRDLTRGGLFTRWFLLNS